MSEIGDAILEGVEGASETHDAFKIREHVETYATSVDVFGTIDELGIPLLFRPLDDLLGCCIRTSAGAGILVTSRRDLHMQRFTAAHELGHFVLEHEGSLDREIRFPGQTTNRDVREIAADAFAAEFLMPKWLFKHHCKRQGWTSEALVDPVNVYQLSLRMAVSYEATCLGLLANKILDQESVNALREVRPKKSKQRLLGSVPLDDPWSDVWLLREEDAGALYEAGPNDVFVMRLAEHAGSGYLWDVSALEDAGFTVLKDDNEDAGDIIGANGTRIVALKGPKTGLHLLGLEERRPWEKAGRPLHSLRFSLSTFGRQSEGMLRRVRPSNDAVVIH